LVKKSGSLLSKEYLGLQMRFVLSQLILVFQDVGEASSSKHYQSVITLWFGGYSVHFIVYFSKSIPLSKEYFKTVSQLI